MFTFHTKQSSSCFCMVVVYCYTNINVPKKKRKKESTFPSHLMHDIEFMSLCAGGVHLRMIDAM